MSPLKFLQKYNNLNLKFTIMIYFFNSSRKSDKLEHPVTICSSSERRALALAIVKFIEWGYKGSPVRIALMILMMFTLNLNINAQSYTREGTTFISSTGELKSEATKTKYTWKDKTGEYPIYISKNGSCYILKTSSKTGKEYKKYLGEEISRQICKELNVEYKPRKHD